MKRMEKTLKNVCYRFLIAKTQAAWLLGRCAPSKKVTYYMLVHQFDLIRIIQFLEKYFVKKEYFQHFFHHSVLWDGFTCRYRVYIETLNEVVFLNIIYVSPTHDDYNLAYAL